MVLGVNPLITSFVKQQAELPPGVHKLQGKFGKPGSLVMELTPRKQESFEKWYDRYSKTLFLNPNPDDPRHFYDYRAWYRAMKRNPQRYAPGVDSVDLLPHGPSDFKTEGHPTEFFKGMP